MTTTLVIMVVITLAIGAGLVGRAESRRRERGNLAYRRRTDDIVNASLGVWIKTPSGPVTGYEPGKPDTWTSIERPHGGKYHQ